MFIVFKTLMNSNESRLKYPKVRCTSAANYFSRCVINIFSLRPFVVQLQLIDTGVAGVETKWEKYIYQLIAGLE